MLRAIADAPAVVPLMGGNTADICATPTSTSTSIAIAVMRIDKRGIREAFRAKFGLSVLPISHRPGLDAPADTKL